MLREKKEQKKWCINIGRKIVIQLMVHSPNVYKLAPANWDLILLYKLVNFGVLKTCPKLTNIEHLEHLRLVI